MMNVTILVCNIRFFLSVFMGEWGRFLQGLMTPEYWKALKKNEALALNGMAIVKPTLLGLGNDLWYLPVTLLYEINTEAFL